MKLKTWMEAHIVRSRWKNKKESKKDKRKKGAGGEATVAPPRAPLDSAGNSPSSPDPPDGAALRLQSSPLCHVLLSLPPPLPPCFVESRYVALDGAPVDFRESPLCPRFDVEHADGRVAEDGDATPVRRSPFFLDRLRDGPGACSPRQRCKIRTNPWLTPKKSSGCCGGERSHRGSSASDCSGSTDHHESASRASTDVGSVAATFPHDPFRSNQGGPSTKQDSRRRRRPSVQRRRQEADATVAPPPFRKDDSDSEDCETLNELGNFDELYEYERETDLLDDAYDDVRRRRGSSRRRHQHQRAPPPPSDTIRRLKDLSGNDDDYSEKLEYADVDEAYSEASGSLEDDDEEVPVRIRVLDEDDCGTQTDSALPSDSELSSLVASAATTPLLETYAAGSSSGSDSGIQPGAAAAAPAARGRSLERIRESLEDKVRQLRLERLLVDEKIREAREEESVRRSERERFQRELVVHRRQVLLRTLHELRLKLERQSSRLHEAYQTTLELQLLRRRRCCHALDGACGGDGDARALDRVSLGRLM